MAQNQLLMGAAVAALCAAGLWNVRWIVENTGKGEKLTRRLGKDRAVWTVGGLFTCGLVFGILLAANIIRPIRW